MSEPQTCKHYHINLDTMTVTYLGETTLDEATKHPSGLSFITTDNGTWVRSDQEPVWRKIKDGKETEITIGNTTAAHRPAHPMGYFGRSIEGVEDKEP